MVRVAKDLFHSEWYFDSCATLGFDVEGCATLHQIAAESQRERDEALRILGEWARRLRSEPELSLRALEVARVARRDFLLHLIDIKQSAGEVFERVAMLAPLGIREELQRLAVEDFDHALMLRDLLAREVHGGPLPRGERPGRVG